MTTGLTVSITDELVAELEKEARLCDKDTSVFMCPYMLQSLLAERAELNAELSRQYLRGLTDQKENFERAYSASDCWTMCESKTSDGLRAMDAAIYAAMQSEAKP